MSLRYMDSIQIFGFDSDRLDDIVRAVKRALAGSYLAADITPRPPEFSSSGYCSYYLSFSSESNAKEAMQMLTNLKGDFGAKVRYIKLEDDTFGFNPAILASMNTKPQEPKREPSRRRETKYSREYEEPERKERSSHRSRHSSSERSSSSHHSHSHHSRSHRSSRDYQGEYSRSRSRSQHSHSSHRHRSHSSSSRRQGSDYSGYSD